MKIKFKKKDGSVRTMEGRPAKKQPRIENGQVIMIEAIRGVKGRFAGSQVRSFYIDKIIND